MQQSVSSRQEIICTSHERIGSECFGQTSALYRKTVTVGKSGFFDIKISTKSTSPRIYEDEKRVVDYFK